MKQEVHGRLQQICSQYILNADSTFSTVEYINLSSTANVWAWRQNYCTSAVIVAPTIVCPPRTEFCDKDTQQKWFRKHFELASHFHLPMFFHMRAAAPDFITILKEHRSATTLIEKFAAPVHMLASWLDHEHASQIIKPAEHMHSTVLSMLPS